MSKLKRLGNVFQSFSQMFFPIGFCLMSDIKLLPEFFTDVFPNRFLSHE